MQLKGKTALVTGGASGLGAASVRMIANAGGNAIILDLNRELGERLASTLQPAARFVQADVSDPLEVESAVEAAFESYGALHVAINCAGIGDPQRVLGKSGPADLDRFAAVVRINLIGTFNVARLAAAAMARNEPNEEGERGVIINTASIAAFDGQVGQAAYAASKGGIVSLTLPMARDLARHGIRVMTIAPGLFDTPMAAGIPEEIKAALAASIPFPPRFGNPAEYARLARHIIENPMLNGEVIRLDGALRMPPR